MASARLVLALTLLTSCGGRTLGDLEPAGDGGANIEIGIEDDSGLADTSIEPDGSTEEDAIVVVDADPPPDASPPPPPPTDAKPPPPPPADGGTVTRITCGMTTCDSATQECCVTPSGGGATAKCIPRDGICSGGVTLSCSTGAACPAGQSCCLRVSMSGGDATCSSMCGGPGAFRLCTTDAECPMGQRCRSTTIGLRACFASGPGG